MNEIPPSQPSSGERQALLAELAETLGTANALVAKLAGELPECGLGGPIKQREAKYPALWKPSRSLIAQDRELGDFVIECARPGTMTLRDIISACEARFGRDRVPSRSAMHRFILAAAKGARPQATRPRA